MTLTARTLCTTGPQHPSSLPDPEHALKVDNWVNLHATIVEIRRNGSHVRTGRVDATTPDSTMLWLSQDGLERRTLFHKLDGYEVWIDKAKAQCQL